METTTGLAAFAASIEGTAFVKALKFSPYGYAIANLAHVLGIALLVGAILPLDLRLLGCRRDLSLSALTKLLAPVAALGLVIAVSAGLVLFSVRAQHYVNVTIFGWKLGLIAAGAALALLFHLRAGLWLDRATRGQEVFHGLTSILCWLGALSAGRMIAYFPN